MEPSVVASKIRHFEARWGAKDEPRMLQSSKYPEQLETVFMTLLCAVRAQSRFSLAPSEDFNCEIFDETLNNFSISSDASHDF